MLYKLGSPLAITLAVSTTCAAVALRASTNPTTLLGKPAAAYDAFFGKPKVESRTEKAMVPGKSYTDEERNALPMGTVTDRTYEWKGMGVHVYQGAVDTVPSAMRFGFWGKKAPKTWQSALAKVGVPAQGVTAKPSPYAKTDKYLSGKGWTGAWYPGGDEQGYQLSIEAVKKG